MSDLNNSDTVDMVDFYLFSPWWLRNDCAGIDYCNDRDFDKSDILEINDLTIFCYAWLYGK